MFTKLFELVPYISLLDSIFYPFSTLKFPLLTPRSFASQRDTHGDSRRRFSGEKRAQTSLFPKLPTTALDFYAASGNVTLEREFLLLGMKVVKFPSILLI